MWRYFIGAAGALMLALAGMFLFRGAAKPEAPALPPAPSGAAATAPRDGEAGPPEAPSATARTREEKRFDRYDKDRNSLVSREEYLLSRRKAYGKLDTNGDGRLTFDEWAIRTTTKFAGADRDKSSTLTRAEFAATAPKPRKAAPKCACPQPKREEDEE